MHKKFLKVLVFVLAGISVGVMFARFNVKDYRHASAVLKRGAAAKPLYINDYNGRQVLALSLKNLQNSKNIEVKMDGAVIQSWYPPVVKMPFYKMNVEGGRFEGVNYGKRLPVYLVLDGTFEHGDLEIIDSSNGSLIQTVHVMRGGSDGEHH